MYQLKKEEMNKIAYIFESWNETLIWSCLQGYLGNAWSDSPCNPVSAQIVIGDFGFFAGIPNKELVKNIPDYFSSEYLYMVPADKKWSELIEEVYKENVVRFMRYAIKKEPDIFDRNKLITNIEKLPSGYSLKSIDREIYEKLKNIDCLKDLCSQFPSYEDFEKHGLGFVVLHGERPVSGAGTYTFYDKGIEIEIDTDEEYRRKGLALICGSRLILECMERGLYPSWDAANKMSVALAEKLGYHFDKEYVTYAVKINR